MKATIETGPPGSHPHADRRNWQPAATIDDYMRNCRDGLENYSGRRSAKILGVSRGKFWRMKLMAQLPDDLLERLMAARPQPSSKALAQVAHMLGGDNKISDVETCPHCGEVLRVRSRVRADLAQIVVDWMIEQRARQ
jgi:hypothetical protein